MADKKPKTALTPYQKKLFLLLSVATFFEGYDFIALTQILPNLREDLGLSRSQGGAMVAAINAGAIFAYFLVRKADAWGRRAVLTITIAGYTAFTFLTAFSWDALSFTVFQFFGRIFLLAEWSIAMVYAAEEFPADRRGMVIGVIQAFSSFGSVLCAGLVPLMLTAPWGWRTVYLVGILPLVLVAYARRNLKETERFEQVTAEHPAPKHPWLEIWKGPYARRLLTVGVIWMFTYVCTQNAIVFWKEFVLEERGFTDAQAGMAISVAAVGSMPLIFLSGKLLDVIGRKPGAVVIFATTSVGVFGAYGLHGQGALTASLVLAIFGVSAVLPVLNAFTTELFPTDLRGDAYAWGNSVIGRIGYVLSPAVVGVAAEGLGWGRAVQLTTAFPVLAVVLILLLLPETANRELEDTAALG